MSTIEQTLKAKSITPSHVAFIGPDLSVLGKETQFDYISLSAQIKPIINKLINAGTTQFVTNAEQGFSQVIFWSIDSVITDLRLHDTINNSLCIPFMQQSDNWDDSGTFGRTLYSKLKAFANNITCAQTVSDDASPETKHDALLAADRAMIDRSDILVTALPSYDMDCAGREVKSAITYARNMNKPVLAMIYSITTDYRNINTMCITEFALIK